MFFHYFSLIFHRFTISGPGHFRSGGPRTGMVPKFSKTHLKIALPPEPEGGGGSAGTWNLRKEAIDNDLGCFRDPRSTLGVPTRLVTFFFLNVFLLLLPILLLILLCFFLYCFLD